MQTFDIIKRTKNEIYLYIRDFISVLGENKFYVCIMCFGLHILMYILNIESV